MENGSPQWKQSLAFSSRIQNSLLSKLLLIWGITASPPEAWGRLLREPRLVARSNVVSNGATADDFEIVSVDGVPGATWSRPVLDSLACSADLSIAEASPVLVSSSASDSEGV